MHIDIPEFVAKWNPRITSYNVCYTKLLRTINVMMGDRPFLPAKPLPECPVHPSNVRLLINKKNAGPNGLNNGIQLFLLADELICTLLNQLLKSRSIVPQSYNFV